MEDNLMNIDNILRQLDAIGISNHNSRSGLSHQRHQKIKASQTSDELLKIVHLVDSHASILREKTSMRYERLARKDCNESKDHMKMLKDLIVTKCSLDLAISVKEMKRQIAELPKEWTVVQITSQYSRQEHFNINMTKYPSTGLFISVFNCGQNKIDPFVVDVGSPTTFLGDKLELMEQLMSILDKDKSLCLKKDGFKNKKDKDAFRAATDGVEPLMKETVKQIEKDWLRHWRCLMVGKYQQSSIDNTIRETVETTFKVMFPNINISKRNKELLYYITKGSPYLQRAEILRAVQYCLNMTKDETLVKEVCRVIQEIQVKINNDTDDTLSRHPVILIIDEYLDIIPWEMLDILLGHPVSRIPSLHFTYFLFKVHEKDIEDGHKIIRNYKNGKFILNPDGDLKRMENRMAGFYKYWLGDWSGIQNRRPTNDEFYNLLESADIFAYAGHGNGTHIVTVEWLQRMYIKAIVLLFGCSSTKIQRQGPQVESYGSYHMYLISRCPCVMGMLWLVRDVSTDHFTTELLSAWIPSSAPIDWANVNKASWRAGDKVIETFTGRSSKSKTKRNSCLEFLRALSSTKVASEHYMTKAACVARGLPVKIKES